MMTIPISLEVKESAYDKIIYFLSHLKDDVIILNRENFKAKNGSKLNQRNVLEKKIDIDALPSPVDKYVGIVSEDEVDLDYKNSRADYLTKKYL
jgi:hypothetical protein